MPSRPPASYKHAGGAGRCTRPTGPPDRSAVVATLALVVTGLDLTAAALVVARLHLTAAALVVAGLDRVAGAALVVGHRPGRHRRLDRRAGRALNWTSVLVPPGAPVSLGLFDPDHPVTVLSPQ